VIRPQPPREDDVYRLARLAGRPVPEVALARFELVRRVRETRPGGVNPIFIAVTYPRDVPLSATPQVTLSLLDNPRETWLSNLWAFVSSMAVAVAFLAAIATTAERPAPSDRHLAPGPTALDGAGPQAS
jgi:hypothetical protein